MSTTRLLDIKQLSAELPMPVRSIQTLKRRKKIPYLAIGHRTVRFDLEKVRKALDAFEVKAIAHS